MQAFKLMETIRIVSPHLFPIAFARSLVAVANYKEDSFRKICIESLRLLALANPSLVSIVDGFVPLLDTVIEPITQPMADSIILSILHLLSDPYSRDIVGNAVDLRVLISSLTDLDSTSSELSTKWKASKSALLLCMRTWVGLITLTSDHMAWATLVRMLRDPKVPMATQEIILDTITEIFEPFTEKIKKSDHAYRHQQQLWLAAEEQNLTAVHLVPADSQHSPGNNSIASDTTSTNTTFSPNSNPYYGSNGATSLKNQGRNM